MLSLYYYHNVNFLMLYSCSYCVYVISGFTSEVLFLLCVALFTWEDHSLAAFPSFSSFYIRVMFRYSF